jgi:HAD superfamily hydrolase (TIGR01490 family)
MRWAGDATAARGVAAHPEHASGPRGAAFFDLDKTLIEGSSAIHFVRAAYRAGLVSRRQLARDVWGNLRFRLHGTTDEQAEVINERILESLAGQRQLELERLRPNVLAGMLPALYPEMIQLAWSHQDEGRAAYIVTAASQNVAGLLANVLLLEGGIGTRYEVEDGRYTGRLDGPFTYGPGKPEAMRELAASEGLDLGASYAYSDSASDLPMLRAVGHPVAVNPDTELERVARAEGWQVMRFDRLHRRLRLAVGAGGLALVGGGGGYLAARARRRPRIGRLIH